MSACISVITVIEFNTIKVFFIGGANKSSYEFHSWKYQNSGATFMQPLYSLFPNRAQGVSYSDSLLLWAMSAEGSEI